MLDGMVGLYLLFFFGWGKNNFNFIKSNILVDFFFFSLSSLTLHHSHSTTHTPPLTLPDIRSCYCVIL